MSNKAKTTTPKPDGKPALTPKLRFPEFRGAEGWSEKPLKEAALINPANSGLPDSFVYIDLESVDAGALKAKTRISRVGAPSRAQRLVERRDIIYQVVRPYQRNNLLCEFADEEDYVASTGYAQLRARGSNRFLYQSIHTDSFVGRVMAKCTGSNYPAINSSDLAEIELPLPPTLPEQQKVAECLSSVDVLIAAQARKLDALKTHKKGLMQQLFPREGETQPRLRFPEFQNAGEWEEVPLSELVGSLDAGVSVNSGDRPATGNEIGVLKTSAVTNGIFEAQENKVVFDEVEIGRVKEPVQGDTIIISRMNTPALVGANAYVETSLENIFLPDRLWAAKSKPGTSMRFVASILGSDKGRAALAKLAKGSSGSMKNITKPDVLAFLVMAPSPDEQQRIADCLTSLDDIIAAQTQKLDALKTHKKGLMQQLFPSPDTNQRH